MWSAIGRQADLQEGVIGVKRPALASRVGWGHRYCLVDGYGYTVVRHCLCGTARGWRFYREKKIPDRFRAQEFEEN